MFANYNQTALERMQELIEQLHKADIAYYRDDAPMMSDREYDLLMDELKDIEKKTGLVLSGSPTQKSFWRNLGGADAGTSHQTHAVSRQDQVCGRSDPICVKAKGAAQLEDGRAYFGSAL